MESLQSVQISVDSIFILRLFLPRSLFGNVTVIKNNLLSSARKLSRESIRRGIISSKDT